MALFYKEVDKNVKPQRQQAWTEKSSSASPAPSAPAVDEKPVVSKTSPATATSEGRNDLDRGSRVSGKLYFNGTARIDGWVEGEITAENGLVIDENAVVTARLKACSVVVAGKVSGDITASQRLELRPSARVVGNLASPILVIHEDASLEGRCATSLDPWREDRKVTVFPKEERPAQAPSNKQA